MIKEFLNDKINKLLILSMCILMCLILILISLPQSIFSYRMEIL